MGNGSVQLAYIHRDEVSHSWHESVWGMFAHDRLNGQHLRDRPLSIRTHPIRMVESRNIVVQAFLDGTDAEWLFWVDTDMGWRADSLDRLLDAADPVKAPIVGGLCFGLYPNGYDGMGGLRFDVTPTIFVIARRVKDNAPVFSPMPSYPDDTVVQVHATGSAFLLIHRGVLEKVRAEHGDHWYDQLRDGVGDVLGEDISFCLRAGAAGAAMFVHTGVPTTHHKSVWIGTEDYVRQHADDHAADPAPDLPLFTHVPATVAALAAGEHEHDGMQKFPTDLDRYAAVIEATRPEVIVETGTRTGASARWFADRGIDVVTVDLNAEAVDFSDPADAHLHRVITWTRGDSADPATVERVRSVVAGRRCMVVLDSDHSAEHVRREIEAYGPMVSPGCYLVVEDTIFGYDRAAHDAHIPGQLGSPLDAVVSHLAGRPEWSRDMAIEQTHPIGSNPAGWWVRNG